MKRKRYSRKFQRQRMAVERMRSSDNIGDLAKESGVTRRKVVPENGALLLVELGLSELNQPSIAKAIDLHMLVLTGGLERTVEEYRDLLAHAGFRFNRVVGTGTDFVVYESLPA